MTQTLHNAFFPVTFHAVILASTNDASRVNYYIGGWKVATF